jgi:hypothetical protein
MIRFNPKEFKIKQPISRGVVVVAVVFAASLAGAVYFYFEANAARKHVGTLEKRLADTENALSKKTQALVDSERAAKERILVIQTKSEADVDALKEKIGAFAKQAAACEIIRKKIGR